MLKSSPGAGASAQKEPKKSKSHTPAHQSMLSKSTQQRPGRYDHGWLRTPTKHEQMHLATWGRQAGSGSPEVWLPPETSQKEVWGMACVDQHRPPARSVTGRYGVILLQPKGTCGHLPRAGEQRPWVGAKPCMSFLSLVGDRGSRAAPIRGRALQRCIAADVRLRQ